MIKLTNREQELVDLLNKGFYSNKELAEGLGVTTQVAQNYIYLLMRRLNFNKRTSFILFLKENKTTKTTKHLTIVR